MEVKTEKTTDEIPFETKTINDSNLTSGKEEVRTEGVNGVKTKTFDVTYTNDKETNRVLVKEEITTQPVAKVIAKGTKVAKPAPAPAPEPSNCDSNYSGCVPIASDVDCAGGSGNGPAYVSGPITVRGSDIYDLDRDGDGIACE
ncbi:G5 domain-containing protein [Candidatus Saccharibacteria bacterium]|nr:G5 domain-containing protein [Candidatus Saccharibacteria bacterium]